MPSPLEQLNRRARVGFILEIDGLAARYYAGPSAPSTTVVPEPYAAKSGLVRYEPGDQKLDDLAAIVEGGGATVNLLITNTNSADQLLRNTAPRTFTLAQEIAKEAGPVDVIVAEDPSTLDAEGVIWVGQEAMLYDGVDGPTKTISVIERGYYGTRLERHRVDVLAGLLPEVHSACCRWLGRRCRVRVYHISPAGAWLGGVVEIEGIIDGSPQEPNGDGIVEISIAPLTGLLRREVGGATSTTTLSVYHPFDGVTAGHVERSELWDVGAAVNEWTQVGAAGVATTTITPVAYRSHQDVFDVSNAERVGPIEIGTDAPLIVQAGSYVGDPDNGGAFDVDQAITYTAYEKVRNMATVLNQRVAIVTPGVPEALTLRDVLARINAAWAPGTNQGAGGTWADAVVTVADPAADGRPSVRFRTNSDHHSGRLVQAIHFDFGGLWTLVDLADPDAPQVPRRGPLGELPVQWLSRRVSLGSKRSSGPQDVMAIRGLCTAAWQPGERWIWVEDDVIPAPDGRVSYVLATYTDLAGRSWDSFVRIADVYPADDVFPGLPGYLLETHEDERSDPAPITWRLGDKAPVIRQAATWRRQPPTRVMLEVLLSGEGDGVNHPTYDRLGRGLGLGLSTNDVLVRSFEGAALPAGPVSTVDVDIRGSVGVSVLFEPWLRAARHAIVDMVNPTTGSRQLALVPLGPASASRSVLTIDRGLWLQNPRPAAFVDDTVVNLLEVRTDYDSREDRWPDPTLIEHKTSIAELGVRAFKEDLRGVYLDGATPGDRRAELLPWALEVFVENGRPRRRVRGRLPYADGAALYCGAIVTLVDCPARGDDGLVGLSGPAPVREIKRVPSEGYVEILLGWNALDTQVKGYAPALKVTEVVDGTRLRVDTAAWVDDTNEVTGAAQNALSFWAVGYPCQAIPKGGFTAKVNTTISAIVGNVVTLAHAHGFDATDLGRIRPRRYQDAAAAHKAGYVFLAGSDLKIGTAPSDVDAHRYG